MADDPRALAVRHWGATDAAGTLACMAAGSRPDRPDDGNRGDGEHPLDELFIVGAKYHEPSAAEREAAARAAEKRAREEEKARRKRVKHTKNVLEGRGDRRERADQGAGYDGKVALIGFCVMLALAFVLASVGFLT
jgi:hypothetical protein